MKIPARFDDLREIKKLFEDLPGVCRVVGVGVTGWPRAGLAYLLPNFQILSYLETNDLPAIRKLCPVVSMEKDLGGVKIEKENTSTMLETKEAQNWLGNTKFLGLFVYKGTVRIDKIVEQLGVKLMSTAGAIRNPLENKRIFRQELIKAGIEPLQGETLQVNDLSERRWEELKQELGEKLVFQLADYVNGGGAGTFFVRDLQGFRKFRQIVKEKALKKDKDLEWVNVTKFIEGEAGSIIGCATRHGVICGRLQKQIIDQPELGGIDGRAGVWQGHDWNARFSPEAQDEGEDLCKKWGEYIYQKEYKGIFGLDVIVDNKNKIYPIECNARYTGAFPVLTMMQLEAGIMPFDVWHLAEWLGLDYEMDIKEVEREYRKTLGGAQLVMHNLEGQEVKVTKKMKAGIYKIPCPHPPTAYAVCGGKRCRRANSNLQIKWDREGFSLLDLKDENEFVLADRMVEKGSLLKLRSKLGRLVFKRQVVDEKGRLLPEIREVVKSVYEGLGLEKI